MVQVTNSKRLNSSKQPKRKTLNLSKKMKSDKTQTKVNNYMMLYNMCILMNI